MCQEIHMYVCQVLEIPNKASVKFDHYHTAQNVLNHLSDKCSKYSVFNMFYIPIFRCSFEQSAQRVHAH